MDDRQKSVKYICSVEETISLNNKKGYDSRYDSFPKESYKSLILMRLYENEVEDNCTNFLDIVWVSMFMQR